MYVCMYIYIYLTLYVVCKRPIYIKDTINPSGKAYNMYVDYETTLQKQPFADVFQYRCSYEFRNIHKKKTVLESFFNKIAALKDWLQFC